MPKKVKNN